MVSPRTNIQPDPAYVVFALTSPIGYVPKKHFELKRQLVLSEDYKGLREEVESVLVNFDLAGELTIKGERNVIRHVEMGGRMWSVKRFKTPNLFQGFVYRWLRSSKAKRSYYNAFKLQSLGIGTPEPLGYFEQEGWRIKESYYLCAHQDYDLDFRVLIHQPKYPDRQKILEEFAVFTYRMQLAGVEFLDHSPGNTLIEKGVDGYNFFLIDLNRMRFRKMSLEQRMRNFRRLWLSKTMIRIMTLAYTEESGEDPEEVHGLMTKYSRQFQKKVNSKHLRRRKRRESTAKAG